MPTGENITGLGDFGIAGIRAGNDAGEFSYGAGNCPPGLENEPPNISGVYKGTTPPCDETISVVRDPRRRVG